MSSASKTPDRTLAQLVDFSRGFSDAGLSASARDKAVELLFDTVACAVAGARCEPARLIERVAPRVDEGPRATIFGSGRTTSTEMAALANTVMVRSYDYNDAYYGHPSDMIPGVLAAAEVAGASGAEVLRAIALAYEVYGAFSRSGPHHLESGLDYGLWMNIGVALAAGTLSRLDATQLAHAASLALLPALPMGAVRWGTLSMMKGASTAFATRNGVLAAMLAREGFTSSPEPFSGIYGLHHFTQPFELRLPLDTTRRVVEMVYVKPIPAENNTIGIVELAPKIRAFAPLEDIESIDIEVASGLEVHMADEPKYDPDTRETADHSLPYVLMRALVDGGITLASYSPERIADAALRPLMRKVRVRGSDELKQLVRASPLNNAERKPARVVVRTRDGREMVETLMDHSGHPDRPAAARRAVIDRKLDICADAVALPAAQRQRIRQAWWGVAELDDIRSAIATLASFDAD